VPASPHLRRDIEGLRAFAVLAVLVHHAFPAVLPGGFAGVDVFFVISGYLIGHGLLEQAGSGNLNLVGFYVRRARRLLPALLVVVFVVWGVGALVLTGPEYESLGRHMAAAALLANNLLLATEVGYFDAPALTKPLLHLWSLGVEEQFYLVAPLLILLGARQRHPCLWILRVGALSLLWLLVAPTPTQGDYFLPHVRFWELAAGVLLAHLVRRARELPQGGPPVIAVGREGAAWAAIVLFSCVLAVASLADVRGPGDLLRPLGLALATAAAASVLLLARGRFPSGVLTRMQRMGPALGMILLVATVVLAPSAEWPGPATVVPVAGTCLLIGAAGRSALGKLLGSSVAVAIGQLSYPLYLWHWPLLAGMRLLVPEAGAPGDLVAVAAAFPLAWVTKILVEDPVRFGRLGPRKVARPATWLLPGGMALAALAGAVTVATNGFVGRLPEGLQHLAAWKPPHVYREWRTDRCYQFVRSEAAFDPACNPRKRDGARLLLLWGDSHAAHLYPPLGGEAGRGSFDLAQWTMGSCPPTLRPLRGEGEGCAARRAQAWQALREYRPDAVLLGAGWALYLESGGSREEHVASLRETIAALHDLGIRDVRVFGVGPLWTASLPADLLRHMQRNRLHRIPERFGRVPEALWELDGALDRVAHGMGASYYSLLKVLCDGRGCLTSVDAAADAPQLLYVDRDHLTPSGARFVLDRTGAWADLQP